jgi:hypothetical protein
VLGCWRFLWCIPASYKKGGTNTAKQNSSFTQPVVSESILFSSYYSFRFPRERKKRGRERVYPSAHLHPKKTQTLLSHRQREEGRIIPRCSKDSSKVDVQRETFVVCGGYLIPHCRRREGGRGGRRILLYAARRR